MDGTSILLWMVVVLLGYGFWVWVKSSHSFQNISDRIRHRIQSGLSVPSATELKAVQENLFRLEQQVQDRLAHLKPVDRFSHQLQKEPLEMNPPLVHVEQLEKFPAPITRPLPRPRSIVRNGLCFTLSDSLWMHIGRMSGERLEDAELQSMLQGPFCRVCLKRLVGRDREYIAEVPVQCRHCGTHWSNKNFGDQPISLLDLKRQIFLSLDREFQTSRRMHG